MMSSSPSQKPHTDANSSKFTFIPSEKIDNGTKYLNTLATSWGVALVYHVLTILMSLCGVLTTAVVLASSTALFVYLVPVGLAVLVVEPPLSLLQLQDVIALRIGLYTPLAIAAVLVSERTDKVIIVGALVTLAAIVPLLGCLQLTVALIQGDVRLATLVRSRVTGIKIKKQELQAMASWSFHGRRWCCCDDCMARSFLSLKGNPRKVFVDLEKVVQFGVVKAITGVLSLMTLLAVAAPAIAIFSGEDLFISRWIGVEGDGVGVCLLVWIFGVVGVVPVAMLSTKLTRALRSVRE